MSAFSEWFSNLWQSLFSSSSTSTDNNNMSRSRGGNTAVNLTFPDTVNYDLAMDLYYNKRAGYKLGAFFCHSIIFMEMAFMGFPHYDIEDLDNIKNKEFWEEKLKYYNETFYMMKQHIEKITLIAGTFLVYPWFDSKTGLVKWMIIKPKFITDIFIDPLTQETTGLLIERKYTYYNDVNKYFYFTEKILYEKNKITITRTGSVPSQLKPLEIRRNPIGILPIVFTNDVEPGEFEGHSEFERILPIIKAYAQINLRAHEECANIKAKLIQQVNDAKIWKKNNNCVDINDFSIEDTDFILNVEGEETKIEVPQNLVDNNIKLMNLDFWGIVEGTGIPEICWGLKTEGNHASAAEQMAVFLAYIGLKRKQFTSPFLELVTISFKLEGQAYNQELPENIIITWNDLSLLTEVEKSEIFKNWSEGFEKLAGVHSISLEDIHEILIKLTDGTITHDFSDFKNQCKEYGAFRSFLDQEYGGMRDFEDLDDKDNKNLNIGNNGNGKKQLISTIYGE
jgi:hypothetical protein